LNKVIWVLMTGFEVRRAGFEDLERVREMRLSLQRHLEASNPLVWRATRDWEGRVEAELEGMLIDGHGRLLVALEGGRVVGFAYGRVHRRAEFLPRCVGEISMVYVEEGFRRRGIGSLLVGELCRFFGSESVEEVTIRYVMGNDEAELFWKSLGFKPVLQTANASLRDLEDRLRGRPLKGLEQP
jgi:ribosomal protein S18 acetylase RimI-like enzyme